MTYASPAWPLTVAEVAALLSAQPVTDLIGTTGVYADQVPEGTGLPYITLGSSSEIPRSFFSRQGADLSDEFHIWAATRGEVQKIWTEVAKVLSGAMLTVSGHQMTVSRVALAATMRDPTGIAHGVVRYEVSTVRTA